MNHYETTAVNTAPDSNNKIHGDDVAEQLGFRGGLVPGVDVWGYLSRPAIDRWGEDFLTSGQMSGRFASPVYDGEPVSVTMTQDGELELSSPDGPVAFGQASVPADPWPPFDLAAGEKSSRPPASADSLTPGTVLMPWTSTWRADKGAEFLELLGEAGSLPGRIRCAHPAWLLRVVNWVLSYHVQLGPWIHVSSEVQHHRLVHDGDHLEFRGVVTDNYERKGHSFVDYDCVALADGEPAMSVKHRAIWHVRGT